MKFYRIRGKLKSRSAATPMLSLPTLHLTSHFSLPSAHTGLFTAMARILPQSLVSSAVRSLGDELSGRRGQKVGAQDKAPVHGGRGDTGCQGPGSGAGSGLRAGDTGSVFRAPSQRPVLRALWPLTLAHFAAGRLRERA